jgi:hypothetical protein
MTVAGAEKFGTASNSDWMAGLAGILTFGGLLAVGFVAAMLIVGGIEPRVWAMGEVAGGGVGITACGVLALGLARVVLRESAEQRGAVALAIVVGASISCLFVTLICLVTGARAGSAFLGWALLVTAACAITTWRFRLQVPRLFWKEVGAILAMATGVAGWSWQIAGAGTALAHTFHAKFWIDYFIHGTVLVQFGSPLAVGQGDVSLAGASPVFYHYGAFMPAAALLQAMELDGVEAATALMLPIGLLFGAVGFYALLRGFAGRLTSLTSVFALACVPDPSFYGLKNGFFGFSWLLFTAPGTGYALGGCAAVLAILREAQAFRDWRRLTLAALLLTATFELRAHFILVLVPTIALAAIADCSFVRRQWASVMVSTVVGLLVIFLLIGVIPELRHAWLGFSSVEQFVVIAHTGNTPTAYDGLYAALRTSLGAGTALCAGVVLLIPCVLGALIVAYPVALVVVFRQRQFALFDLMPVWILIAWLAVVLLAPIAGNQDPTEYSHRSFPLIYATALVWTIVLGVRATIAANHFRRPTAVLCGLGFLTIMVAAECFLWPHDPAQPLQAWGVGFYNQHLQPGIVRAAEFLRRHVHPGDRLAVTPIDPTARLVDTPIILVSLAGLPVVLSRVGIQLLHGGADKELTTARLAVLQAVEAKPDTAEAALRKLGVTWWVSQRESAGADPPAAFFDEGIRVERLPTSGH